MEINLCSSVPQSLTFLDANVNLTNSNSSEAKSTGSAAGQRATRGQSSSEVSSLTHPQTRANIHQHSFASNYSTALPFPSLARDIFGTLIAICEPSYHLCPVKAWPS
jgi:hypothetical protein